MVDDTDTDKLIKEIEKFQIEEVPKVMKEYFCKNCGAKSCNLEIKKEESPIEKIKEFQKIVDKHNNEIKTKHTIFGSKQSDKKWRISIFMCYLGIFEEGEERGWINEYMTIYYRRTCNITCPVCKVRNTFKIGVKE